MSSACLWHSLRRSGLAACPLAVLLGLGLLLVGCNNGGNQGHLAPQSSSNPTLEQQAVDNLLTLYRTALRQADIDRVDALLAPTAATDVQALRATLTATFRTRTVIALEILADTIQVAPDSRSVAFLEVESTEDPATLEQQTHLFRTTWGLTQDTVNGTITIRIGTVQREGPLVQVTIPGQVQAGTLTRVEVQGTGAPFVLAGVEVTVPETGAVQALVATGDLWHGVFTPPLQPSPQPLRVQLHGARGETLVLQHPYRLRVLGEGVVQPVGGTGSTHLFAVTVTPDGTVWAGGYGGATLYRVPPGATRATRVGNLLTHPDGRVEALATDQLGRLHILLIDLANNTVVGHGDIVRDPAFPALLCQTVNIFDAAYPLLDPHGQPSASARVVAAGGGDVWLFGSDGGVARVQDSFRNGQCPARGITVRYDPVFRRGTSALPTSIVPAFVAEADGTLWFGTALGLTRLQQGRFTPVPFDRTITVQGNVATLEAFFQVVAQALFEARPLTTVALQGVSFVEQFGRPLVKEDLIFSAVVTAPEQLWVGTLGGGLRRIDGRGTTPQDTRPEPLTKLDGLPSNLIVALAVAPDGVLWVATDKGMSRLRVAGDAVTLTTFAALDGLALPVRDVAVDTAGTVWLATDGGLFRMVAQGGTVQGLVVDAAGHPVEGADVTLQGTPFHAVTDATGRFVLANLPSGPQQLQVDGRLAVSGPFTTGSRTITVPDEGTQTLETIVLEPQPEELALMAVSGDRQTGTVGTTLAAPLVVAVVQAGGTPVPGFPVTFTVTAGQGTLVPGQPVLTDAQGRAAVTLTLGTQAGGRQVMATAPGLAPVTFTVTGQPDRATARLLQISGNNQVGQPGAELPAPLVVRLEDQFGNPLAGETITGTIIQGEGTLLPVTTGGVPAGALTSQLVQPSTSAPVMVATDAAGTAAFRLIAGPSGGTVVTEVRTPDLPAVAPVQFLTIVGLISPVGIAVETDGHLVVGDSGLRAIVRVDPRSGNRILVSDDVTGHGLSFVSPGSIDVEANGQLVVIDDFLPGVVRVDPRSGDRMLVSGEGRGGGPSFVGPIDIAVEPDSHLAVVDFSRSAVLRIDPHTGDRTLVSGEGRGGGPPLVEPTSIAVEADGHLVVVNQELIGAVVRVDPVSGDRTLLSGSSTRRGSGPDLIYPRGIAVEADGHLVVTNSGADWVVRVDPLSGDRTLLSGGSRGSGPPLDGLASITVEPDGHLIVVDLSLRAVVRVDPHSGDRTMVGGAARSGRGGGPPLVESTSIAVEADGHLVVVDSFSRAVVRVNPRNGDRTLLSGEGRGGGPPYRDPRAIAVESNGQLVVADDFLPGVVRVDPRSGDRMLVSGEGRGGGPSFVGPINIAVEPDGHLVVVDRNISDPTVQAVLRVDPRSGDRTLVSGRGRGGGPSFVAPTGIAVEADGQLVVVDQTLHAVLRIDPHSGNRALVSGMGRGNGPVINFPQGIALESDGHLVIINLGGLETVVRMDPRSGDRALVAGARRGGGPSLTAPAGIAVEANGNLAVVDDSLNAVVRVDPRTGDRTILSLAASQP